MFLRGAFCNHFPQKLKGLLVKVGLFLSFGAFACDQFIARLVRDAHSFKQGFDRFLKLNQRSIKTKS
ncbi:hypothetical protein ECB93_00475 [Helicobacter pylori]|nr:hypothetical protein ECB93_00475 [Helicobacter pylori]RVY20711.1 hypothetical protein ECB95_00475 [Helicobacter pylori]RVY93798.1 hypothetical protein EC502_00015 [Helicobacter pylori]